MQIPIVRIEHPGQCPQQGPTPTVERFSRRQQVGQRRRPIGQVWQVAQQLPSRHPVLDRPEQVGRLQPAARLRIDATIEQLPAAPQPLFQSFDVGPGGLDQRLLVRAGELVDLAGRAAPQPTRSGQPAMQVGRDFPVRVCGAPVDQLA